MPSTLYAAVSMLTSIHTLLRRLPQTHYFTGRHHAQAGTPHPRPVTLPEAHRNALQVPMAQALAEARRARPPVRVLRVVEAGETSAHGGRMVISGRMADVCAELDRMVAREAVLRP